MENLLFLGVPILKHIRVYQCYSNNLFEVVSIAQLVEVTDTRILNKQVHLCRCLLMSHIHILDRSD